MCPRTGVQRAQGRPHAVPVDEVDALRALSEAEDHHRLESAGHGVVGDLPRVGIYPVVDELAVVVRWLVVVRRLVAATRPVVVCRLVAVS
ncbi:MAG: hypothetical protein ACTHYM_02050 [Actinomycetaceae bacterium]